MASTVPYVPNTAWADGSGGGTPITAAKLNTLEQGISDAHLMPAVRVFHNTTQSIPNLTDTALVFNSERFDTVGGVASTQHDTTTNTSRLTCRYAGKYLVTGHLEWSGTGTTGTRRIKVRLNGTTIIAVGTPGDATADANTGSNVTTIYDLAVNDYVELIVLQSSGSALNVVSTGNYSPEFMMVRVA